MKKTYYGAGDLWATRVCLEEDDLPKEDDTGGDQLKHKRKKKSDRGH
jgi:hypothetical protein